MPAQERTSSIPVELPPMGAATPEQNAIKSATHWVWTPYMDINNLGPWGIRSLLGYRGVAWSTLKRCTPYPLSNMVQQEVDRAAVAEIHQSGYSLNMNAENMPKVDYIKYAQDQANELGESYGDEHGLRVLVPLIGMDDPELVNRIVQVVQPFAYLIFEMADEFSPATVEAKIKASNLNKGEADKARQLGAIFLRGADRARLKAESEYNALITSMSDASIGKPGISEPNDFHKWICVNLNKPTPKRINRMETAQEASGVDSAMIKALLERDAERAQELAEMRAQIAAQTKPAEKAKV